MRIVPYLALILAPPLLAAPALAQQFGDQHVISVERSRVVHAIDLDNDGDADVLTQSGWFENDGAGSFGTRQLIAGGGGWHYGDFDRDGDTDILRPTQSGAEWCENANGVFQVTYPVTSSFPGANAIRACDFDNDGDSDVIAFSGTATQGSVRIEWFENLGTGTFALGVPLIHSFINLNGSPHIVTDDLDQDGDQDVIIQNYASSHLYWWENLGSGQFSSNLEVARTWSNPEALHTADLTGNGFPDVASCYYWTDKVVAWANLGSGVFSGQQDISTAVDECRAVYSGDIDGDGDTDLLSGSASLVAWYQNDGLGNFGVQRPISNQVGNVDSLEVADLDCDGDLDVLSADGAQIVWHENLASEPDIDRDDDGLEDALELSIYRTDPLLLDTDGDGIGDGTELGVTTGTVDTDPAVFVPDSDPTTTSNPLNHDSDSGGVPDGVEDQNRDGAVDTWETDPNNSSDEAFAFYVSNLESGKVVKFEAYNATPLQALVPGYSTAGPGPTSLGIGVIVDLSQPIQTLPPTLADALGRASWDGPRVPGDIPPGLPIWLQLIEVPLNGAAHRVSNPILLPVGAN